MRKVFGKEAGDLGQVQLQANSQIRGKVHSQGMRLVEVRARVSCEFGADEIAVGADGSFEFSAVPPGKVSLIVMYVEAGAKGPADLQHVSETLQLKSGDTAKVTIDLK